MVGLREHGKERVDAVRVCFPQCVKVPLGVLDDACEPRVELDEPVFALRGVKELEVRLREARDDDVCEQLT